MARCYKKTPPDFFFFFFFLSPDFRNAFTNLLGHESRQAVWFHYSPGEKKKKKAARARIGKPRGRQAHLETHASQFIFYFGWCQIPRSSFQEASQSPKPRSNVAAHPLTKETFNTALCKSQSTDRSTRISKALPKQTQSYSLGNSLSESRFDVSHTALPIGQSSPSKTTRVRCVPFPAGIVFSREEKE